MLWERYRAWWGAHQLNEEDPLLLDRMKTDEMFKRKEKMEAKRAKMSKTQLKRLVRKKEVQFKKRQTRREMAKITEQEALLQEEKDARTLAEFQRLAAGGGPEVKTV